MSFHPSNLMVFPNAYSNILTFGLMTYDRPESHLLKVTLPESWSYVKKKKNTVVETLNSLLCSGSKWRRTKMSSKIKLKTKTTRNRALEENSHKSGRIFVHRVSVSNLRTSSPSSVDGTSYFDGKKNRILSALEH